MLEHEDENNVQITVAECSADEVHDDSLPVQQSEQTDEVQGPEDLVRTDLAEAGEFRNKRLPNANRRKVRQPRHMDKVINIMVRSHDNEVRVRVCGTEFATEDGSGDSTNHIQRCYDSNVQVNHDVAISDVNNKKMASNSVSENESITNLNCVAARRGRSLQRSCQVQNNKRMPTRRPVAVKGRCDAETNLGRAEQSGNCNTGPRQRSRRIEGHTERTKKNARMAESQDDLAVPVIRECGLFSGRTSRTVERRHLPRKSRRPIASLRENTNDEPVSLGCASHLDAGNREMKDSVPGNSTGTSSASSSSSSSSSECSSTDSECGASSKSGGALSTMNKISNGSDVLNPARYLCYICDGAFTKHDMKYHMRMHRRQKKAQKRKKKKKRVLEEALNGEVEDASTEKPGVVAQNKRKARLPTRRPPKSAKKRMNEKPICKKALKNGRDVETDSELDDDDDDGDETYEDVTEGRRDEESCAATKSDRKARTSTRRKPTKQPKKIMNEKPSRKRAVKNGCNVETESELDDNDVTEGQRDEESCAAPKNERKARKPKQAKKIVKEKPSRKRALTNGHNVETSSDADDVTGDVDEAKCSSDDAASPDCRASDAPGGKQAPKVYKKLKCNVCGGLFRKDYLVEHVRIHTGEKPHACGQCTKTFVTAGALKVHIEMCHSDGRGSFRCDLCSGTYMSRFGLKQHLLTHAEAKRFQCEVCGKAFKLNGQLSAHMKTHSEHLPFQCEACGRRYKTTRGLKLHRRRDHQGVRPTFPCHLCERVFKQHRSLKDHILWHDGASPYVCQFCGKVLISRKILNCHLLIHEEKKPFSCSVCSKTFRQRSVLKRHMTVHTGVKPFSCEQCGKGFIHRAYLDKHARVAHQNGGSGDLTDLELTAAQENPGSVGLFAYM